MTELERLFIDIVFRHYNRSGDQMWGTDGGIIFYTSQPYRFDYYWPNVHKAEAFTPGAPPLNSWMIAVTQQIKLPPGVTLD